MDSAARVIDLNADLGEGLGDDDALLAVVTSANVACGAHAGNDATMARVCAVAVARGVAIGAHVSYEDREGFGRREMEVPAAELAAVVAAQVLRLAGHAAAAGGAVAYVKPHGALYNRIVTERSEADAVVAGVVEATVSLGSRLALLGLPGSQALQSAEAAGLATATEAFADRAYTAAGALVPRSEPGAVIDDERAVIARSLTIAAGGPIAAADGTPVTVTAQSLCVHGDTPGAATLAARLRDELRSAGFSLEAFVGRA